MRSVHKDTSKGLGEKEEGQEHPGETKGKETQEDARDVRRDWNRYLRSSPPAAAEQAARSSSSVGWAVWSVEADGHVGRQFALSQGYTRLPRQTNEGHDLTWMREAR